MQISSYNNVGISQSRKQAFGNRLDVNRLAQQYMEEAVDIAQTKWNPVGAVKQLTAKYLPSLKIFQEFFSGSAVCAAKTGYDEQAGKFVLRAQKIIVPRRLFIFPSQAKRADFVGDMVHEVTHAFQNQDKEYSANAMLNLGLGKRSVEYLKRLNEFSYNLFKYIEFSVIAPKIFLNNLNNSNIRISSYTDFNKISNSIMYDVDKCIESILNKALSSRFGKNFEKDKRFILGSLKLNLQHEVDAYRHGNTAFKMASGRQYQNNMDVVPYLYERTIESLKRLQVQKASL